LWEGNNGAWGKGVALLVSEGSPYEKENETKNTVLPQMGSQAWEKEGKRGAPDFGGKKRQKLGNDGSSPVASKGELPMWEVTPSVKKGAPIPRVARSKRQKKKVLVEGRQCPLYTATTLTKYFSASNGRRERTAPTRNPPSLGRGVRKGVAFGGERQYSGKWSGKTRKDARRQKGKLCILPGGEGRQVASKKKNCYVHTKGASP